MLAIDVVLGLIIATKVVYVLSSLASFVLTQLETNAPQQYKNQNKNQPQPKHTIKRVNEVSEMLFIIGMAILLIYHFNPHAYQPFSKHSLMLFYVFGVLLLIQYAQKLYHYVDNEKEKKEETKYKYTPT